MQEHVPLRLPVPLTLCCQGPELDGIVRNGLLPWRRSASMRAASRPTSARSNTLLISWESEWNEEQQGWRFSHTAVPHNAAFPDSNVSTSATLETSVANVSGWSEKNREHFVRNALQRLGSPAYISGAGSLGSCWGLWFPGMEKLGGVGGAAVILITVPGLWARTPALLTPAQLARCSTYSPPGDPYERCCPANSSCNHESPLNPWRLVRSFCHNEDGRIQLRKKRGYYKK